MRPSTGAIVGRLHRGRPGALPPYITLGNPLHQGLKRVVGEGGGALGSTHDPFRLDFEPGIGLKLPEVVLPESVGAARFDARWDLLHSLETPRGLEHASPGSAPARLGRWYDLAHSLIASRQSLAALDVALEPGRLRESYGPHRFGQCCLIARRLVEAGVPFVGVSALEHSRRGRIRAMAAGTCTTAGVGSPAGCSTRRLSMLLDDLHHRGLLASTLVVAVGEFGHTPKINDRRPRPLELVLLGQQQPVEAVTRAAARSETSDRRGERPDSGPSPADLGADPRRLGITTTDLTSSACRPWERPSKICSERRAGDDLTALLVRAGAPGSYAGVGGGHTVFGRLGGIVRLPNP